MMDKLKIPARIQICITDNLEPGKEGQYPDWSATSAGKYKYTFKHRKEKIVALMAKTKRSGDTLVPERAPNENNG